jgi:hypothetical protein
MKQLLVVLSALFLISGSASAAGRSFGMGSGRRSGGFSGGRTHGLAAQRGGSRRAAGTPPAPSAQDTPGIPQVAGALARDNSMFVKQEPTGEPVRYFVVDAGGYLRPAANDGLAQPITGPGAFMGRGDYQTGGGTSGGGYGTFYGGGSNSGSSGH